MLLPVLPCYHCCGSQYSRDISFQALQGALYDDQVEGTGPGEYNHFLIDRLDYVFQS